jgi:hypothetical protein
MKTQTRSNKNMIPPTTKETLLEIGGGNLFTA